MKIDFSMSKQSPLLLAYISGENSMSYFEFPNYAVLIPDVSSFQTTLSFSSYSDTRVSFGDPVPCKVNWKVATLSELK